MNALLLNIVELVYLFTRKTDPTIIQYKIDDCFLLGVNLIKDLEIYFKNYFSFKINHKIIQNKSCKMLDFLKRNTKEI